MVKHCEHWTHSTNTVIIGYNYYWKFEDDKWYKLYGYCPNNNNIVSYIKRPALRGSWTIGSLDFLHVVSSIWRYFHNVPSKVFSTTWQHGSCTHNLNHCCDKATKMQAKERQEGQGVKMEWKKNATDASFVPIHWSFTVSISLSLDGKLCSVSSKFPWKSFIMQANARKFVQTSVLYVFLVYARTCAFVSLKST